MSKSAEKTARVNVWINANEAKGSLKDLRGEAAKLRNELARMDKNSAQFRETAARLRIVKKEILAVEKAAAGSSFSIKKLADGFNRYFTLLTAGIASITGVVFGIKNMIQKNAELEDSFADVQKTTGLTRDEVKSLYQDLKTINTRTTRKELLELATVAGKLGIEGRGNILGFVKAADKIKVALAEDLGDNAEEAINTVGKLVDIFKLKEKFGIEQAMLKVGSAINSLGAASAASESNIVEFMKRLGGVAPNAKMTIDQVAGLGATLDSLGQTSEVSGTAMSQFILGMFKKTPEFAKLAGMSLGDFNALLSKDTNGALIKVLEGLKGNNAGMQEMAANLDGLGLDGARAVSVIGVLANNVDTLKKQQKLANEEFDKGTSLIEEFNTKNQTLGASLSIIGKSLAGMFVNGSVLKGLTNVVGKIREWVEVPLSEELEKERTKVNGLVLALQDATVPMEVRNKLVKELENMAPKLLENQDKENINYEELRKNLALYNKEMIKKIALQSKEEEFMAAATKAGKALEKYSLAEEKAGKSTELFVDQIKNRVPSLAPILTKLRKEYENDGDLLKYYTKLNDLADNNGMAYMTGAKRNAALAFGDLQRAKKFYNIATTEYERIQKEQLALQDKLGSWSTTTEMTNKEGDEKIIGGILMVFKSGQWIVKEPGGGGTGDLKKTLDEKKRLQYIYFEDLKKTYYKYIKDINEATQGQSESLEMRIEDIQIKMAESAKEAADDLGTYHETLLDKLTEFSGNTLKEIELEAQQVADIFNNLQSAQLINLEAYYDKQIELAGNDEAKKADLEAQYAEKRKALQKKYADIQFAITTGQIIANTAQAVIKTIAEFGIPWGLIPAAIATALGASQIAVANAQRQQVKGMQTGGFSPEQETIIRVSEKGPEWIAPNWMLRSPLYQPHIKMLEKARVRGYAEGGYRGKSETLKQVQSDGGGIGVYNALAMQTYEMLKLIKERLEKPVPAVAYYGQDEVNKIRERSDILETIENDSLK